MHIILLKNKFRPYQKKIIPLKLNKTFHGLDYTFSEDKTQINIIWLISGLYPIILKDDSS